MQVVACDLTENLGFYNRQGILRRIEMMKKDTEQIRKKKVFNL